MISIANPLIGKEEKEAVIEVLDSGMLAQGPRVAAFEAAFADMAGTGYAIATSSGTTALHTALLAHGIGPGDEVITTPFSFIASANSVLYTGAAPVFADIDPVTFNIDPAQIEPLITSRTRAILVVHLFGLPADVTAIMPLAKKHNLVVIEDACQSHGAMVHGRPVGSFGTGCFSLYPTKNITSAEGGMITTNDPDLAQMCRVIRQHGMSQQYHHTMLGFNHRMTDIHAAIGLAQLRKLAAFNHARIGNAAYLTRHLKGVTVPAGRPGVDHVYHQYTIRVSGGRRDALKQHLHNHGIGAGVYYPIPIHRQPLYARQAGFRELSLPHAEQAAEEVLSLPVHPALSLADLEQIVSAVNSFS
jgi:perosamine synthetase